MARIFIVDDRGARAADFETARARFDDENRKVFGADLDVHAHTPQNQIAGINALVAAEIGEELVRAALYGGSISYAPGTFLDALGSLLDIRRAQGSKSRVVATLRGVAGTVVPAGRLAKNTNGDTFSTEESVIIRDGGTKVGMIAEKEGPVDVRANSLTEIVSIIAGWETITNEEDGVAGRNKESDASYRATLKARTAHSSIGSLAALESALSKAGATRVKILENSTSSAVTQSGVLLPAHSILVIADGGLVDDVSRAVDNHRGMGVNTYTSLEGSPFMLASAQTITNGRLTFNGSTISGFNLSGQPIAGIVSALNSATSLVEFSSASDRLLAFHSWSPTTEGFADVGGNISESDRMLPVFTPISAKAAGSAVHLVFPDRVLSVTGGVLKYTSAGSEVTQNVGWTRRQNLLLGSVPNAIPSDATGITISATSLESPHLSGLTLAEFPVELETAGATDAPVIPAATGYPRNRGAAIWASALGTVTGWQFRRYQDSSYLTNDWVDVPADQFSGGELRGNNSNNGLQITGLANDIPARIEIRAVNGTHGSTAAQSVVVVPSDDAPEISDAHIDGDLITLSYDLPLASRTTSTPSGWTITASGHTITVTKERASGRQIYLTLSDNIEQGETWSIARTSNTNGPFGLNGVAASTFSARQLTNDTLAGVPSAPIDLIATRTSTGWRAQWAANHDGGLAIDRYEISSRALDANIWSSWENVTGTSYSVSTTLPPERVRVRASNPNARSATLLGLSANSSTYPFSRSLPQRLLVSVSIYRDDSITTEDFAAIKTSLIELVNSYNIGDSIWQADLQARVESIRSIRLASALQVTSDGVAINGQAQNTYNRWTLSPDDISITFVN